MMAYLGEWITHIVLLVLIATFFDLLLPNSSMRQYVKLVIGLLIMILILSPLLHLFSFDYEQLLMRAEEMMERGNQHNEEQIREKQNRVEQLQQELIHEEVGGVLGQQIKASLNGQFPTLSFTEIHVVLHQQADPVEVEQLRVSLEQVEEKQVEENGEQQREMSEVKEIPVIQPIQIEIGQTSSEAEPEPVTVEEIKMEQEVVTYLEQEWNISVDKIYFSWTRR